MKLNEKLRAFLEQQFPEALATEPCCTCGAPNHVRLLAFSVNGTPTAVILPEGRDFTCTELESVLGTGPVEPLLGSPQDAAFADFELGSPRLFSDPMFPVLYFDEALLDYPDLVFCPMMFSGLKGRCFRVPTKTFLDLTYAVVVPLTVSGVPTVNDWAV